MSHALKQCYVIIRILPAIATLLGSAPSYASATQASLLADSQFNSDMHQFFHWTGMMVRYKKQQKIPDSQCDRVSFHPCYAIQEWHKLISELRDKPLEEQMRRVNDFANAFPYTTDIDNWGKDNVWETPYEFLTVSGNCKDYAIFKYYSMRMLGVPASRLRLIVLEDLNLGGVIHAILGVHKGNTLYILDNQIKQVVKADTIYHYLPIYAINEEGWWWYQNQ